MSRPLVGLTADPGQTTARPGRLSHKSVLGVGGIVDHLDAERVGEEGAAVLG